MTKQGVGSVIVAVVVGGVLGYSLASSNTAVHTVPTAVTTDDNGTHNTTTTKDTTHDMASMMDDMTAALAGKTGAAFDQQFLKDMIVHHEGAVAMAEMALQYAGDERIKELSRSIITAQEKEIADMRAWQATMTDKP